MAQSVREPAVAGQFYSGTPELLTQQVEKLTRRGLKEEKAIGVVSPHAGLMYSGAVAGEVYSTVQLPEPVLLLGPNHTGLGNRASAMTEGEWAIPTATLEIDREFAIQLLDTITILKQDSHAHLFEHSLEVQLPFIAFFRKDTKIVPVTLMSLSLEESSELGKGIAHSIQSFQHDVLIVASSDMSHYVSDEVARKKDMVAIEKILDLDPEGLYDAVKKYDISMCGYVPVAVMLFAAKKLGATNAKLIRYATSGEVSGDLHQVVGYAGIVIK